MFGPALLLLSRWGWDYKRRLRRSLPFFRKQLGQSGRETRFANTEVLKGNPNMDANSMEVQRERNRDDESGQTRADSTKYKCKVSPEENERSHLDIVNREAISPPCPYLPCLLTSVQNAIPPNCERLQENWRCECGYITNKLRSSATQRFG